MKVAQHRLRHGAQCETFQTVSAVRPSDYEIYLLGLNCLLHKIQRRGILDDLAMFDLRQARLASDEFRHSGPRGLQVNGVGIDRDRLCPGAVNDWPRSMNQNHLS